MIKADLDPGMAFDRVDDVDRSGEVGRGRKRGAEVWGDVGEGSTRRLKRGVLRRVGYDGSQRKSDGYPSKLA